MKRLLRLLAVLAVLGFLLTACTEAIINPGDPTEDPAPEDPHEEPADKDEEPSDEDAPPVVPLWSTDVYGFTFPHVTVSGEGTILVTYPEPFLDGTMERVLLTVLDEDGSVLKEREFTNAMNQQPKIASFDDGDLLLHFDSSNTDAGLALHKLNAYGDDIAGSPVHINAQTSIPIMSVVGEGATTYTLVWHDIKGMNILRRTFAADTTGNWESDEFFTSADGFHHLAVHPGMEVGLVLHSKGSQLRATVFHTVSGTILANDVLVYEAEDELEMADAAFTPDGHLLVYMEGPDPDAEGSLVALLRYDVAGAIDAACSGTDWTAVEALRPTVRIYGHPSGPDDAYDLEIVSNEEYLISTVSPRRDGYSG